MPLELTGLIASEIRVMLLGMGSFPWERPMLASSQVPNRHASAQILKAQDEDFRLRDQKSTQRLPSQQTTILFMPTLEAPISHAVQRASLFGEMQVRETICQTLPTGS